MRILYITNIHNPYRDEFFEQLGKRCDLTVLFERQGSANRDSSWFTNASGHHYHERMLSGVISTKDKFKAMVEVINEGWSLIVVGSYNSRSQILAILYMRKNGIPYVVNSDGAIFETPGPKGLIRKFVLHGADGYIVAGKSSVPGARHEVGKRAPIFSYPFTSLTRERCSRLVNTTVNRDPNLILIVGRFLPYKGIDVALKALSRLSKELRIRIVGSGGRSAALEHLVKQMGMSNVEIVPFLSSDELAEEYLKAGLFILPSRKECWGLVVNEAAACGCPIVSTWGAGASIEFLSEQYPQYLAKPKSPASLADAIERWLHTSALERDRYQRYLRQKSTEFTIETTVDAHLDMFEYFSCRSEGETAVSGNESSLHA